MHRWDSFIRELIHVDRHNSIVLQQYKKHFHIIFFDCLRLCIVLCIVALPTSASHKF